MIKLLKNNVFCLETENNGYIFRITQYGDAESLYYGAKIDERDIGTLIKKRSLLLVNALYADGDETYCIDRMKLEYSVPYRGDSRSSALIVGLGCADMTDFVYSRADKNIDITDIAMPVPRDYNESLRITLKDRLHDGLIAELWYFIYEKSDTIARFTRIVNNCSDDAVILKAMSAQYDIGGSSREIVTFQGAWGRERMPRKTSLECGRFTAGSYSGMSSAECNPFFIVKDKAATERHGEAYGFNLIYSGSHELSAEITPYGGLRILNGVQSEGFAYSLKPNEHFDTPISISTYSACGIGKITKSMHNFVYRHITTNKEVPIMLNSWEAVYFDINESKLIKFADKAHELGFDGVVIDDGWFVGRNDDKRALGDWTEDRTKFPHGIAHYADYLRSKGMRLGIWIEPEMISEYSELYNNHSDWALVNKRARSIVGRNQRILDMTNQDVAEYVYESLVRLVAKYRTSYIKWDFNRRFSDILGGEGSAYYYRYVKALYAVLKRFTAKYPDVIIENCASGGGRFDLGMLYFCPMGWVSDNTDPLSRVEIQEGTGYGYPISVMLNHISASPSHQTRRVSSFGTRLDTAMIGRFGAQYDVTQTSQEDDALIKAGILKYHEYKKILLGASLYRISQDDNTHVWQIMASNGDKGLVYFMLKRFYSVNELKNIKLVELDENSDYRIKGGFIDIVAGGRTLMDNGIVLSDNYQGVSFSENSLAMTDLSTIILEINKINSSNI